VKAKNKFGWGDFSDWWTFTTITPIPSTVKLISPVDTLVYDTTQTNVEFNWAPAEYADYYQVELSYKDDFAEAFFSTDSIADTTFTYSDFISGSFYWRVRGVNVAGNGEWSSASVMLIITSVEEDAIPKKFALYQNYPNPFNPTTRISYSIPMHSVSAENPATTGGQSVVNVTLTVYNALGQKVTTLVNKEQLPGNYTVQFNATNLPSGIYFYRLKAGDFVSTKKMILMK
jgi:hypothetical protein